MAMTSAELLVDTMAGAGVRHTVEPALREAFSHHGPALVDVVTARHELSVPPQIEAAQAKGFGLYMLRAILSGRGDEIVELATTNLFH